MLAHDLSKSNVSLKSYEVDLCWLTFIIFNEARGGGVGLVRPEQACFVFSCVFSYLVDCEDL